MKNKKKILVLSPHTDDAELGAGGYIVKLLEEGHELFWVVFSTANESIPKELPETILADEFTKVVRQLNLKETNYEINNYRVRKLHEHRQEILEKLVSFGNDFKPDIVIGPSVNDYHQDHQVVANEMIRAFKTRCSIICYELPWNNVRFDNQMFVSLEDRHVKVKLDLLNNYQSQKIKNRFYFDNEYIIGQLRVKGTCISKKYAESFEVVRWIQ